MTGISAGRATIPTGGEAGAVRTPHRFSTRGLPEARRIELWESHNAASLVGLRCRTLGGASLEAAQVNLQLSQLHLAHVEAVSHVVERSADLIRSSPTEAVALYFTLVGEAFFYSGDEVRTVQPGQLLICDVDRPFMRGFSQGLEELAVKIPKRVFREFGAHAVPDGPLVVDFAHSADTNAYAAALAQIVGMSVGPRTADGADEEGVLDLVAALVDHGSDRTASTHYAAAEVCISRRLRDPALSAAAVAHGIGVSERHLSRAFAEMGTSVPRYIRRRRVELALRMLRSPSYAGRTVEQIALSCGFVSAGHFSRVFREQTGMRPGEARRPARGFASEGP